MSTTHRLRKSAVMRNHLDIQLNDPVSKLFFLQRLDNAHLLSRNRALIVQRARARFRVDPALVDRSGFPINVRSKALLQMTKKFELKDNYLIGVISDTHGRLPAGVQKAFEKVDLIIHAGDIGDEKVLKALSQISPIVAVRGNMDFGKWANNLPKSEFIEIGPIVVYVLHIANRFEVAPGNSDFKAIISGHTHRPDIYEKNGITFLNPGSASYPKFGHPASVALLSLQRNGLSVRLIEFTD